MASGIDITLGPIGSVFSAEIVDPLEFTAVTISNAGQLRPATISLATSGYLFLASTPAGSGGCLMLRNMQTGFPYLKIRIVQPITLYCLPDKIAGNLDIAVVNQDT